MVLLNESPSTRAKWILNFLPTENDEPLTITGASIVVVVRNPITKEIVLEASTANGKILIEADILADFDQVATTGWFQMRFTLADMRTVCPGQYEVGCTIALDDEEPDELFVGTVIIHDGIVR